MLVSPPAANTAACAASEIFLRFSIASLSLRAFVLELPLGATPLRIRLASFGVKFTKLISISITGDVFKLAAADIELFRVVDRIEELLVFRRDELGLELDCFFDDFEEVAARAAAAAAAASANPWQWLTEGGREGGVGGIDLRRVECSGVGWREIGL